MDCWTLEAMLVISSWTYSEMRANAYCYCRCCLPFFIAGLLLPGRSPPLEYLGGGGLVFPFAHCTSAMAAVASRVGKRPCFRCGHDLMFKLVFRVKSNQ